MAGFFKEGSKDFLVAGLGTHFCTNRSESR
jgi:hypothetical protein